VERCLFPARRKQHDNFLSHWGRKCKSSPVARTIKNSRFCSKTRCKNGCFFTYWQASLSGLSFTFYIVCATITVNICI